MRDGGDYGADDDDVCSRLWFLQAFLLADRFGKMADSKMASKMTADEAHSLAVAGMAWRVKYRQTDESGKVIRVMVYIGSLGVHKKNRGGVYPAGKRCRSLCIEVVGEVGFLKENVEHAVVAVEEVPTDVASSRGEKFVSASQYNIKQCKQDEFLKGCFNEPHNNVRYSLLSHNHMMLVLRAFLTQARWKIPTNVEKNLVTCDANGRLSLSAVAEHANGIQLAQMVKEGLEIEVLSHRMDIEEPTAASTISQALNLANEMGLRTSELTAVSVLKGEMIAQMGKDLSQDVAYTSVLERVRRELKLAASEPDLPDVFDFLRSLGVGKNTYVDKLLQFGAAFVDSKKRQLRFSAFAVVNKVNHDYPLSRVAIIKRAYRKKPSNTFCPNPETKWAEIDKTFLEKFEQLLFYFHETRLAAVQKLPTEDQEKFLAAVDCSAADDFFVKATRTGRWKSDLKTIEETLLQSTLTFFEQLEKAEAADREREELRESYRDDDGAAPSAEVGDSAAVADEDDKAKWIDFSRVQAPPAPAPEENSAASSSNVLISAANIPQFNERTGMRITPETEDFPAPTSNTPTDRYVVLPWRQWKRENTLGSLEADKATAVAVLQGLHEDFDVSSFPIEMYVHNKHAKVFATKRLQAGEICLPPCVPKQSRVVEESEHPSAVEIRVLSLRSAESAVNSIVGPILRTRKSKLTPELKLPTAVDSAAVAGSVNENLSEDGKWILDHGTPDALNPFWAVRRLTRAALDKERSNTKANQWLPRFTCQLSDVELADVSIYSSLQMENRTRTMIVPFMTSAEDIEEGEELILEVNASAKKSIKRTWRDAATDEEKARKLKAKTAENKKQQSAALD